MENLNPPATVEYWMYKREKELRAKAENKLHQIGSLIGGEHMGSFEFISLISKIKTILKE
jgi:hypothetical protein